METEKNDFENVVSSLSALTVNNGSVVFEPGVRLNPSTLFVPSSVVSEYDSEPSGA
jgi:hypothetical protein